MLTDMRRTQPIVMEDRQPSTAKPARTPRLVRELATIRAMVGMYCRDFHGHGRPLCAECTELFAYATRRLDRCVFGHDKPTCANCKVHCYNTQMRDRVRVVMRHAGPRMLLRHPLLAMRHVIDGRRPAPELPQPHRVQSARAGPATAPQAAPPPKSRR
jgi:hypothetical protein